MPTGLVIKSISGFFTVQTAEGLFVCQIPGRLKQTRKQTDLVTVGDRVTISTHPDGSGLIEAVAERARVLSRSRPGGAPVPWAANANRCWWPIPTR